MQVRADSDYGHATPRLNDLLAARGDIEGLRARVPSVVSWFSRRGACDALPRYRRNRIRRRCDAGDSTILVRD